MTKRANSSMRRDVRSFTWTGFLITLLVLAVASVVSVTKQRSYIELERQREKHVVVLRHYRELLSQLKDVETGRRGFVLTGKESYLQPYNQALPVIQAQLEALQALAPEDEEVAEALETLVPVVEERVNLAQLSVSEMRANGYDAVRQHEIGEDGRVAMDAARRQIDALIVAKMTAMSQLQAQSMREAWLASVTVVGCGVVSLLLVSTIFLVLSRELRLRGRLERAYAEANEQLASSVEQLERQRQELVQLAELSDLLQAAMSMQEASAVVAQYMPRLFGNSRGGIYLISPSRDLAERVSHWGAEPLLPSSLEPEQCWALRRGRLHVSEGGTASVACGHYVATPYLGICIPLTAQGDALGVMVLCYEEGTGLPEGDRVFVQTCAEQLSLGLGNLRLRETLQVQATRDPLTGLFNRRYMQETLDREIARGARQGEPVGVLLTDIDHFKQFNDTHGHAAGDVVIRELGRFLQANVRGGDVACRYGGEEFTLIFPGASKEITLQRAEAICREARHLRLRYENIELGSITLSVGVACFPQDAATSTGTLKAADMALYRAKQNGRDQVAAAAASEVTVAKTVAGEPPP